MKKLVYITVLMLSFFLLQGCMSFTTGSGAPAGATVVNDKRTLQTIADDQNIEHTADTQISKNTVLNTNSHIVVVSFNHAVLLVGQVPTQNVRQRVEAMVQALPKVTRVYNQLDIAAPTSPMTRSNDTWITTKVKSQMIGAKGLNSGQIKVVTENGTVYLMGVVTRKQADLASDVTRRVTGVKRVVTLFEYTHS
jgi:osmotically-inducible protein OsmY